MLKTKVKPAIRERKFFSGSLAFGQTLVPVVEVSLALGLGVTVQVPDSRQRVWRMVTMTENRRQLRRSFGIFQGYPWCKESRLVMSQARGKRSDSSSLIL